MPKVTVLMPVYNGELYLREAIDSILDQTFQDFEFLIINDGSTDSTREIICSYDDLRIRLIDNNYNLGLTRSLNKGLKLAEGEFIARQDADDVSESERLAKQVAFLETHPEVALVGTWYKQIDTQGNLICECQLPYDCTQIRWGLLFYSPFIHSAVMFQKSVVLEQIGFYNEVAIYAQDYELWCRIALRQQIANLSDYLIKWRVHPSSVTATYGNIQQDTMLHIQISNIGHLLGSEEAERWSNGVHLKEMTSLWLGELEELKDMNLQKLNQVIERIFHLHHAFCNYYKLDWEESKNHRNEVLIHLSNQLLDLAYYYSERDKYTAWRLLNRACRVNFSLLLTKNFILLFLKLMIGSPLVREIRHITQEKLEQKSICDET
ncbi:glycosyltransferase [Nostoc sp. FACHB-973]|nr:glycosyltransferase [Nostoc sp. FACHB-973]